MKLSVDDFAIFTDLGEAPPESAEFADRTEKKFVRNGKPIKVAQNNAGRVEVEVEDCRSSFVSAAALIASESFADLPRWALNQTNFLTKKVPGRRSRSDSVLREFD